MRTKLDFVNDQFCQMYFSFSKDEVNKLFEQVFDEFGYLDNSLDAREEVKNKIDFDILEDKMEESEIVIIGPRSTKFMTSIEKNKPIMGITQMCILPEDINISLPTFIPEELYKFEIDDNTVDNFVREILIENNLYRLENVARVLEDSIITYDLCYTSDDLLIKKVENQKFDMENDDDFDSAIFKNKKIGNEVVLDKGEVVTIAKITKIEKKVPFELNNEIVGKIKFGAIKTKESFLKRIKNTLEFQKDIQISIFYIIEAILNSNQFDFSDIVLNHFLKPIKNIEEHNKDSLVQNIKRMLITEYLIKIVELKTDDEDLSDEVNKKMNDLSKLIFLADGRKSQSFTRTLFEDQIRQVKLLEYCKEAGLISNIKL